MSSDDVLQTCIDAVLAGRKTPAECGAQYPQLADLESDLKTALALRGMQSLTMSAAGDGRIEARLRQRASALKAAEPMARPAQAPALRLRWVVGPALAATLLLAGIGTTAAAGSSNPGDLLYGVKRAGESAQTLLSPPSGRAVVYVGLARHRLDELSVVLQRARPDVETVTQLGNDLTDQTTQALALVDAAPTTQQPDILTNLANLTNDQQTLLATAVHTAPTAAQAGLQRALEASAAEHGRAQERLAQVLGASKPESSPTGSPTATASSTPQPTASVTGTVGVSEVPPGQTKVPPGQTDVPPGQTHVPPGQTQVPPGQTHMPPGHTNEPPGQTRVPPGQTDVPPGQTNIPPGQDKTPGPNKSVDQGGP